MKQQYIYIGILAALLTTLFTGCKKEEGTVTLGAVIKNTVYMNEKVYISDHTPCWHNGDQVNINGTTYSIVAASGASAQIPEVTRHDTYRAIFPASIVNSNNTNISDNSSISVTLPSEQYFQMVGNHQRVDVPMGAYMTSGSTLHLYNLCSVVRVTVSNSLNTDLSLSSIILHAAQARLSGPGTVTVSGAESNSIRMNSNNSVNSHTVSLVFTEDAPATVDALGSSTFDIIVPEFTTDDIDITVFTTDGQFFTLSKSNVGLTHNTITTVTANVTELNQYPPAELISGPAFNSLIPSTATSIEFLYETPWVTSGTLLSTSNSAAPIFGNLEGNVWRITTPARSINANTNCSQMFKNKNNLQSINFNSGFNSSNVTNMNSMFEGCSRLSNLDISSFNTSIVTNMSSMFDGCSRLSNLDISSFNTSNVTNMSKMFKECLYLSNLDLSNFNTQNVTDMSSMFEQCHIYADGGDFNLSSFNTSNVTNMSYMFAGGLIPDISSFNTSNVTNMSHMFAGCYVFELDLSNFNTSNVTNMSGMFGGCSSLLSLNLSSFNTSNVTDMSYMFAGCGSQYGELSINLSNFNTSNVTNMSGMFLECYNCSLNLSNFNTQNVTDMSYMFYRTSKWENPHDGDDYWLIGISNIDLSNFNTASVTNMSYMFGECVGIRSLNLSNFNMSNVTSKTGMCSNLSIHTGENQEENTCTITCPLSVQTAMQSGTNLPGPDQVTFTWVRPTSN